MIALLTLHSTHSTLRTTVTFDYDWKFQLGDPATAQPPLEVASLDSFFHTDDEACGCVPVAHACNDLTRMRLTRGRGEVVSSAVGTAGWIA